MKHDGERWKINEIDEMLSYKTKPVIAMEKRRNKEGQKKLGKWKKNSSVRISFTLIKALLDEVVLRLFKWRHTEENKKGT